MLFEVPNKHVHVNLIYRRVISDQRYFVSKPFLAHSPICLLKSDNLRSLQCKIIVFHHPARMEESVTMHLMDSRVNVPKLRLAFTMPVTCVIVSPNLNSLNQQLFMILLKYQDMSMETSICEQTDRHKLTDRQTELKALPVCKLCIQAITINFINEVRENNLCFFVHRWLARFKVNWYFI